jgi:aryl-alcohol dehydrogenase-like predicted oxidoreductase
LQGSATAAGVSWAGPYLCLGATGVGKPTTRKLGRTGFEATTLGLGGQASLQWTPSGVEPEQIILKAFDLGVNYFDTSNVYGPSQSNYGEAFRRLHLIPGTAGYDEAKRRAIFLAGKTFLRWGKGSRPGVRSFTNGPRGSTAVDDLKRTLSQIFGDGEGYYPPGAYVDLFQTHFLASMMEVEAIYEGLDDTHPEAERIGALAALVDYRDGTNRTGLNPKEEKLIRHIGISGHHSPVLMECLQRDEQNIIDTLLVTFNANDRLYFNQQYNVIPVAVAKDMGIIAMKVFADGAMYTKEATWSRRPEHVVRSVGSPSLPSRMLVEYVLSTPGIATAIIGIGQIDDEPRRCQLGQNLSAAQIRPESLSQTEREAIEHKGADVKGGQTNYFQPPAEPLGPPREPAVAQQRRDRQRIARLTWHTAYAADQPIRHYQIRRDNRKVGQVEHQPQTTKSPFAFDDALSDQAAHSYRIVTVDAVARTAATDELRLT